MQKQKKQPQKTRLSAISQIIAALALAAALASAAQAAEPFSSTGDCLRCDIGCNSTSETKVKSSIENPSPENMLSDGIAYEDNSKPLKTNAAASTDESSIADIY